MLAVIMPEKQCNEATLCAQHCDTSVGCCVSRRCWWPLMRWCWCLRRASTRSQSRTTSVTSQCSSSRPCRRTSRSGACLPCGRNECPSQMMIRSNDFPARLMSVTIMVWVSSDPMTVACEQKVAYEACSSRWFRVTLSTAQTACTQTALPVRALGFVYLPGMADAHITLQQPSIRGPAPACCQRQQGTCAPETRIGTTPRHTEAQRRCCQMLNAQVVVDLNVFSASCSANGQWLPTDASSKQ